MSTLDEPSTPEPGRPAASTPEPDSRRAPRRPRDSGRLGEREWAEGGRRHAASGTAIVGAALVGLLVGGGIVAAVDGHVIGAMVADIAATTACCTSSSMGAAGRSPNGEAPPPGARDAVAGPCGPAASDGIMVSRNVLIADDPDQHCCIKAKGNGGEQGEPATRAACGPKLSSRTVLMSGCAHGPMMSRSKEPFDVVSPARTG